MPAPVMKPEAVADEEGEEIGAEARWVVASGREDTEEPEVGADEGAGVSADAAGPQSVHVVSVMVISP